jgi:hypothetical protein
MIVFFAPDNASNSCPSMSNLIRITFFKLNESNLSKLNVSLLEDSRTS